jgi:TPR repeat protein
VVKNEVTAMEWYTKAANLGNPVAMTCLGHYYDQGLAGLVKNIPEACRYYNQARDFKNLNRLINTNDKALRQEILKTFSILYSNDSLLDIRKNWEPTDPITGEEFNKDDRVIVLKSLLNGMVNGVYLLKSLAQTITNKDPLSNELFYFWVADERLS